MVDRDVATRNLRNGSITLKDRTGTPLELLVPIEEGDMSWTETDATTVVKNRGVISHRAVVSEVPVELSFTIKYVAIKGRSETGADPTVYEVLHGTGNAAAWVSVEDCGAYAVDLHFAITSPCLASASDEDELLVFSGFHAETYNPVEGEEYNTIAISGDALLTKPVATRV